MPCLNRIMCYIDPLVTRETHRRCAICLKVAYSISFVILVHTHTNNSSVNTSCTYTSIVKSFQELTGKGAHSSVILINLRWISLHYLMMQAYIKLPATLPNRVYRFFPNFANHDHLIELCDNYWNFQYF